MLLPARKAQGGAGVGSQEQAPAGGGKKGLGSARQGGRPLAQGEGGAEGDSARSPSLALGERLGHPPFGIDGGQGQFDQALDQAPG